MIAGFAAMAAIAAPAAERSAGDGPQWPNVPAENLPAPNPRPAFIDADEVTARILRPKPGDLDADATGSVASSGPQWPNVPAEKLPASKPRPAVADRDEVRAGISRAKPAHPESDVTGSAAFWPNLPPDRRPPSPFAFETGARYWFSGGKVRFAFRNGSPFFGNPTSTLDWRGLTAHSGELFARLDHRPSGLFAKGMVGLGAVTEGHIDDRDFLVGQLKFSDTTSGVNSGNLSYAMIDLGWAYSPVVGVRLSFLAGYHFWHEKMSAFGIVCNQASFVVAGCPSSGAIPVGFDTAVFTYEPTWHAVRLGFVGKFNITDRWSVSGEIAGVPYAALQNKDSHLRQSPADLGPAPNVITQSRYAYGVETEMFVSYALSSNIEIGGGVRYWGLVSRYGSVASGPTFSIKDTVTNFDQQRYGVLAQLKARF
jgi:hypothetical protein